jgi:hypothetical protein
MVRHTARIIGFALLGLLGSVMRPNSSALWVSQGRCDQQSNDKGGQDGILLRDFVSDRPSGLSTRRRLATVANLPYESPRVFYESKIRSRVI